ncbi:MAG TPA: GIY-YIG nuclease family protein [Gemmatimonadales bacterium]|jgi:excinuclease ABC subunit C
MAVGALTLGLQDHALLHRRVKALAEKRPGVYRMLDATGQVVYVGKAKEIRTRLLSYFRARYPEQKAARILHSTADIQWTYAPSEFAALLRELRLIQRHHPRHNVRMNRLRRAGFIKLSDGPAPMLYVGRSVGGSDVRHYGPFAQTSQLRDALLVLNHLLGLRDCALRTAIAYAEQGDLFLPDRRAGCIRHELGTCTAPCAGFVSEAEYRRRVDVATAFIEARAIEPLDQVVRAMDRASDSQNYELAAWWRERFDALTWLLGACAQAHAAVEALSFVYHDPGTFGDDRAYIIVRGTVRESAASPRTPIEREAFRSLVSQHVGARGSPGPIPVEAIDETLLLLNWFRRRPGAMRRTVPLEQWLGEN